MSSHSLLQDSQLLLQGRDGVRLLVLDGPLQELQHLLPQEQLQHVAVSDGVFEQRVEVAGQVPHALRHFPVGLLQAGDLGQADVQGLAQLGQAQLRSLSPGLLPGERLFYLQEGNTESK